jgi:membrane protein
MMAAGIAFYGLLAIFPAMSAIISVYGLVADPVRISNQLAELSGVLPGEALTLIAGELHALVTAPSEKLGLGLVVSVVLALWSSMNSTSMLMQTLTIAYEEEDDRGIVHFYLLALALTVGLMLFMLSALFLVAVVPAMLDWLPLPPLWRDGVKLVRWPILALLVMAGLAVLYRFAPRRTRPRWHVFGAGTIAASLLWLAGSAGFSYYVTRFGSYDKTYGSLGAVVILLMWFYVTGYIILAGAELNAEMEGAHARIAALPAAQCDSRPTAAPLLPTRKSRSAP